MSLRAAFFAAALAGAGCTHVQPPAADAVQSPFPDLGGRTVMLLPVQGATPVMTLPESADTARPVSVLGPQARASLEAELAYWVPESAASARWVLPDAVDRGAQRSPALEVRPRELAVSDLARARLESIGDPLYGDLRRLSILMDARLALLPVGAVWITEQGGGGRVHLAAALVDTFGGAVLWQGVVAGTVGAQDDPVVFASTAQALARVIRP